MGLPGGGGEDSVNNGLDTVLYKSKHTFNTLDGTISLISIVHFLFHQYLPFLQDFFSVQKIRLGDKIQPRLQ